jgi:hypothetical protein
MIPNQYDEERQGGYHDRPNYAARQSPEEIAEDGKSYKDHQGRPTQNLNPPDCGRIRLFWRGWRCDFPCHFLISIRSVA